MQNGLSEWEETYKSRYLLELRENIAEELRGEFENQIVSLLDQERSKLQDQNEDILE